MLQKFSIDWKLPLAVCAVVMAVVATFSILTYREVSRSTEDAAADRVKSFATQLVLSLESTLDKGLARMTASASPPPLVDFLGSPDRTPAQADAARAVLDSFLNSVEATSDYAAIELLDLDRRRVLAVGPDRERIATLGTEDFIPSPAPATGGVGPLMQLGDRLVVASFVPVVREERAIGHVVRWAYVALSAATRARSAGLLAPEASLSVGSEGGVWTDFERVVPAPLQDLSRVGEILRVERQDGARLAMVARVRESPWIVVIEYPERLTTEPVRRLIERAGVVAVLVLLLGFGGVWWTARRITAPLRALTTASESLVGNPSDDPQIARGDEIVRLRATFERMSDRVHEAQRRLEAKVVELRDAREREQAARAVAEEANSRKDEFLAMLAHELRNPLSPILTALTVVRHPRASPAEREQSLAAIERQVVNMRRMVDDLLDVSRITSGTVALNRRPTDVSTLVRHAIETARPLIDAKRHRVHFSLPDPPLIIEVDATRMEQVLANLTMNAAKYTEPGGQIWVSVAREGDETVFSVRDDGIGIPADQLGRIFDLFYQGDASIHRSRGGLGIGLTLVRKLVELHGGTVSVSSGGAGQGSEFHVRVPNRAPAGESESAPQLRAPHAAPEALRVLVVEDAVDTRELLKLVLELDGHDVRTAEDGIEGLACFRSFDPHVMVLDIGLPGMDGFELAAQVRRYGHDVLLIAATGYGDAETRARVREVGFDEHLVKPIAHAELTAILARVKAVRARVTSSEQS